MGEIHYARCPADTWPLETAKTKAGGRISPPTPFGFTTRQSKTAMSWSGKGDCPGGGTGRSGQGCPMKIHALPSGSLAIALDITDDPRADDLLLSIRYEGSMAEIRRDGQKVADGFYDGNAFEVSLRHLGTVSLTLRTAPLHDQEDVFTDRPPRFEHGAASQAPVHHFEAARNAGIASRSSPLGCRPRNTLPHRSWPMRQRSVYRLCSIACSSSARLSMQSTVSFAVWMRSRYKSRFPFSAASAVPRGKSI